MAKDAIIVDANLLLLLAVGEYDPSLIGKRRLDVFNERDYDRLLRLAAGYRENWTTPYILAELSNLADSCVPQSKQGDLRAFLRGFVNQLDESWTAAAELCDSNDFLRLGLSDASICRLAREAALIVTVDGPLYQYLLGIGANAQNFNHRTDR